MQPGSSWDPNLNVLGQAWRNKKTSAWTCAVRMGFQSSPYEGSFLQLGSSWDPSLNVFGQVWGRLLPLPGPVQSEWNSKAPIKKVAFCTQVPPCSTCDPSLNVLGQVWENFGPLPGPVQSEWISKAPLKEAAFCNQAPPGIPI